MTRWPRNWQRNWNEVSNQHTCHWCHLATSNPDW